MIGTFSIGNKEDSWELDRGDVLFVVLAVLAVLLTCELLKLLIGVVFGEMDAGEVDVG